MSVVHALPVSEPEPPSWDSVWTVEDYAVWARISTATVYEAVKRGELDFARLPAGRAIRLSGPALAARFMVPGYAEGGGDEVRGSNTQKPRAFTPSASARNNY